MKRIVSSRTAAQPKIRILLWLLLALCGCTTGREHSDHPGIKEQVQGDPHRRPETVLSTMECVADWQLAHPAKHRTTDWTQGALYAGIMALDRISPSPRFGEAMRRIGETNQWQLGPSWYNADDHCVGQMYAELARRCEDPGMIGPMRQQFDGIMARPAPVPSLDFSRRGAGDRWSWCDALFMAPPAWTRLWSATGDRKYLDYAVTNWWMTSDYLYDSEEHLFYRDSTYFNRLEANGKRVFWGRGNGWVMAGLVRVLQDVPADHPDRRRFEQQFREMALKIRQCQQADGLWRSSLLDPDSYPLRETSGSGFYTYALAWGVNEGLLERDHFTPSIWGAWQGLLKCVTPEGRLTHVQPIGADPRKFDTNHTDVYGVGAFLLAGSEVYRLAGGEILEGGAVSKDAGAGDDFQRIVQRYRQSMGREMDRSLQENMASDPASTRAWVASCGGDGTWPDVDYQDEDRAFWKACHHLDRTRLLARSLTNPADPLYRNADLEAAVIRALDLWLAKRFQNPNWWWNQIGVPGKMCDILMLLEDRLSGSRRAAALEVLAQAGKPRNGGGANTLWIADLALQHAALTRDVQAAGECARVIHGEIKVGTGEGIQADYSFHQHGPRLQQFAYGRAYFTTAVRLAWQLRGTRWAAPHEKIEILGDLALRGNQWMCRGVDTVPSTLDRSVSRPAALRWADIRSSLELLRELLPSRAGELQSFLERQNNAGEPLVGARAFPRSDFAAFHRPAFSFFLKVMSDRTRASETGLNSEHLGGKFQNCGDHYLLRDGREYFDLAPVWDWQLLPGLTVAEGRRDPLPQSFAGTVSDGISSATVMDYRLGLGRDVRLSAKKFWVCHGDIVVGLIGDLNSVDDRPVRTSLEQCLLRERVVVGNGTRVTRVQADGAEHGGLSWAQHSGFTYVPLAGLKLTVKAGTAQGSWRAINAGLSPELVTKPVLQIVMEHGSATVPQSSGYVILARPAEEARELVKNPPWHVVQNNARTQAVQFDDGTIAVAFHEPGEIPVRAGEVLGASRPCLVLRRASQTWVCDPTQRGGEVELRVGEKNLTLQLPANGQTVAPEDV